MIHCPVCNRNVYHLVPAHPQWATAEVCEECAATLRQAEIDGWAAAKAEYAGKKAGAGQ